MSLASVLLLPMSVLREINQYCHCLKCAAWESKILPRSSFRAKRPVDDCGSNVTIQYRSEIKWFRIVCEDREKDSSHDADYLEVTTGVLPLFVLCGVLAHRFPLSTLLNFDWFGLAGSAEEPNLHGMMLHDSDETPKEELASARERFQDDAVFWIAQALDQAELSPPPLP